MNDINIYGARWCKDTNRVITFFEEHNIPYQLLEIDDKEQGKKYTQKNIEINNGKRITPTLEIEDEYLSNPSNKDLEKLIQERFPEDDQTFCSNGNVLKDGDTVLLTRDLDIKGSSLNLKQGTALSKIKVTGDPEYIDCRIGKSTLAIKTKFVKKKS